MNEEVKEILEQVNDLSRAMKDMNSIIIDIYIKLLRVK